LLNKINAADFSKMIISAAHNLENNKKLVDELNVFPVPDGDTGTNMSKTFISAEGVLLDNEFESVGEVANAISMATLRGARGNSGVILSQIIRGLAKGIKDKKEIDSKDFAFALKEASDTAYRAVMKPTEGTILTVIRCSADSAKSADDLDFISLMEKIVEGGNKALLETPKLLPALMQAGVVDAGGKGLMYIFEGMLHALKTGDVIPLTDGATPVAVVLPKKDTSDIKFSYCTEFIIKKNKFNASGEKLKKEIENRGDSLIVIDDLDIIKVHIHTNNPGFVIEKAILMGELSDIKIDNMKEQHENNIALSMPLKPYGLIAVGAGDGICEILKDSGADEVISGGQTMNPSADDILTAINNISAENIIILPNNKNIILAAEQAATMSEKNVIVIPTKSVPEGLASLISFDGNKNVDENKENMISAAMGVVSGLVTYAVRDTSVNGNEISKGDILGLKNNDIAFTGENPKEVVLKLTKDMINDETELVTILYGEEVSEDDAREIADELEEEYSDIDISLYYGGQPVYYYILSAE